MTAVQEAPRVERTTSLIAAPNAVEIARAEALEVIALALDAAAWGQEECGLDGPSASSDALDDATVALEALLQRPDLLLALASSVAGD